MSANILERLTTVIEERRTADPGTSYVASLQQRGLDAMLKKLGEEATEVIIAAKNPSQEALVNEMADLWFHALIVLAARDVSSQQVLAELERRFGLSGQTEKAARTQTGQRSDQAAKASVPAG